MRNKLLFVFALGSLCFQFSLAQTKGSWNYCVATVNWTVASGNGIRGASGVTEFYSTIFRSAKGDPYADSSAFRKYLDDYFHAQHMTYSYATYTYSAYGFTTQPVCSQGISPDNNPHQVAERELNAASGSTWPQVVMTDFPDIGSPFNGDKPYSAPVPDQLNASDSSYDANGRKSLQLNQNIPNVGEQKRTPIVTQPHKNRYTSN